MRTVLQYDEETDEFKDKPSNLQVFLLEKNGETPTGKEIELGQTPFNLAQFANNSVNATTT